MHPPQKNYNKKKKINRAFLVVQWLRLCVSNPNAGNTGLIPGQGRHYMPHGTAKKKSENINNNNNRTSLVVQ